MQVDDCVAVFGASSFIGSCFVNLLTDKGLEVSTYSKASYQIQDRVHQNEDPYSLNSLKDFISESGARTLYFFSWAGVESSAHNGRVQFKNVGLLQNLLDSVGGSSGFHVVGLGSQAEYGERLGQISEQDPLVPLTDYGKAKVSVRSTLMDWSSATGNLSTWARVFSTYGAGDQRPWLINQLVSGAVSRRPIELKHPQKYWDYLHVSDAAEAIHVAAESLLGGDFNIASCQPRRLGDISNLICREAGFPETEFRYDQLPDVPGLRVSSTRLKELTGWYPKTTLELGVRELVEKERGRTSQS
jgi:nucleoside-diphosphate-sugar epimerase